MTALAASTDRQFWRALPTSAKVDSVGVSLRRPNESDLATLLTRCRDDQLTYAPIGGSLNSEVPDGLKAHHWTTALPDGAFAHAVNAIRSWAVHRGAGLVVVSDGPIAVGTNVVLNAPLPLGFVDATCRIVEVVDEPDRCGFAYGTLSVHPERGEESFLVVRDASGVRFDVQAVSAPKHPIARAIPPVADRLQDAAVRRYLAAITRVVAG